MKPEDTIDFHIRWLWLKIFRLYNAEAAKFGGTMSVGYVLLNIDKDGTPSTKLGPKMGVESRSLTRTLKSMEQNGLIERTPSQTDRRVVLIRLTEEGKKYRDTSREVVRGLNEYLQDHLTEGEINQFITAAKKITALLDSDGIRDKFDAVEKTRKSKQTNQVFNHEHTKN